MPIKTLFLDRDGVINERIPDAYINHWDDFRFCRKAIEALQILRKQFDYLLIVTNQQGIGKGILTVQQLEELHQQMETVLRQSGVAIDGIYYCGDLKSKQPNCRKPKPAMALSAQRDFPSIDFEQAVMVGDSISDLQFGRNLGMKTIHIATKLDERYLWPQHEADWDEQYNSLWDWAKHL